jgi:hypothetical protein
MTLRKSQVDCPAGVPGLDSEMENTRPLTKPELNLNFTVDFSANGLEFLEHMQSDPVADSQFWRISIDGVIGQ